MNGAWAWSYLRGPELEALEQRLMLSVASSEDAAVAAAATGDPSAAAYVPAQLLIKLKEPLPAEAVTPAATLAPLTSSPTFGRLAIQPVSTSTVTSTLAPLASAPLAGAPTLSLSRATLSAPVISASTLGPVAAYPDPSADLADAAAPADASMDALLAQYAAGPMTSVFAASAVAVPTATPVLDPNYVLPTATAVAAAAPMAALRPGQEDLARWYSIPLATGVSVEDAAAAFLGDPAVDYAEPNYVRTLTDQIPYPHASKQLLLGTDKQRALGCLLYDLQRQDIRTGVSDVAVSRSLPYQPDLPGTRRRGGFLFWRTRRLHQRCR